MQDLSPEILKGVALLGNAKDVPETAFKPLTEMVFAILLRRTDETKISENPILSKLDPIVLKQAYSSLVSFVLEGAKINADPVVLKGVLEQENVDAQRATFITTLYSTTKEALRTILSTTSFHYPHITNIDWRLDYFIKSNAMEKVNTPIYMISLETKEAQQLGMNSDSSETGKMEFTCTLEQLQDLHIRLKDAAKQVERSATTFE